MIVGGAMPVAKTVNLNNPAELRANFFLKEGKWA